VPEATVVIYKMIGESPIKTQVLSDKTDSTGTLSWSAYPLDTYYIDIYYADVLKGSYIINPRTSLDVYWITIDIGTEGVIPTPVTIYIDWKNTPDEVVYLSAVPIDVQLNATESSGYDSIIITGVQNDVIISTATYPVTPTTSYNFTHSFGGGVFAGDSDIIVNIQLWKSGVKIYTFSKIITYPQYQAVSGFLAAFSAVAEDLGQPLSLIIAIVVTILLLATITLSGMPTNPLMLSAIGLFAVAFFMVFGFFDTGLSIYGTDVIWVAFVGMAIMVGYLGYRSVSR